ncbi:hypothetical protein [Winogradskyella sp. SYSU M77433]|uniref:hypothetical protein n=1 Tax=Winogradskyella sp. SYSU M77433 TaxID=3042722 RepID=UPI00247FC217|nr:hypothetical protein [Winogradskyella sp. SYSU M77433]MDH7911168.1 hypothetical protein [Winogradskyella sp. SYSU M77433]
MNIEELKSNIKWWESKRWVFNVLVGLSGLFAIFNFLAESQYKWTFEDTIGVLIWGIGANIFYSLGTLLELFDWYYLDSKIGIKSFRLFFFISGTFLSCIYTFWCVLVYFLGTAF